MQDRDNFRPTLQSRGSKFRNGNKQLNSDVNLKAPACQKGETAFDWLATKSNLLENYTSPIALMPNTMKPHLKDRPAENKPAYYKPRPSLKKDHQNNTLYKLAVGS
jgi:hypothetical protein